MTSAGSMSGVNWRRENFTLMQPARDFTASVLASPGTPSSKTWPFASSPITNRSTRYVWPTMTFPSSLKSGRKNALASCTASLMALIPVFIGLEILLTDGQKSRNCVQDLAQKRALLQRHPLLAITKTIHRVIVHDADGLH